MTTAAAKMSGREPTAAAAASGAVIRLTANATMGITQLELRVIPPAGGTTAVTSSGHDWPGRWDRAPAPLSGAGSMGTAQATSAR